MPKRALQLRRESLADLADADLADLAGVAAGAATTTCPTWKPFQCLTNESFCTGTCIYPEA